ncbi:hypothetical protein LTR10_000611 [Elasticomyces elasticus]|nr:hypothetical protein LTR10_000611 [Elasticomyces elasticus]KAK4980140.1 hypothetical protein LTR42_000447 [Elasticomyces elasticus]
MRLHTNISDRLVDIFIGTITADSKPYRVQQVLLESLSDYFTKALRADTFDEGKAGRLQTPDDDGYSWEVLLHWAVHRHMVNGHMLPIDCWIMGDEYQIHAFQNEVMLEMLMYYSAITAEYDILEHGIDSTCPRTLVRRLLVEELVEMVYGTKDVNLDELDNLTGVGVVGDILRAKNKHDSNNVAFNACTRFGLEHEGEVGVGPGDRLIEVYVGERRSESKPFRVQQVLLEQLSEYFVKALRRDSFSEGEDGRLSFPEDDLDVWEVLLHWAVVRSLPAWSSTNGKEKEALLIRCWVLGDKYQLSPFQNEVMLDLIMYQSTDLAGVENLMLGVKLTRPGSELRRVMAQELVWRIQAHGDVEVSQISELDGTMSTVDFLKAQTEYYEDKDMAFTGQSKFGSTPPSDDVLGPQGIWKEYMVGDFVPQRAWLWNKSIDMWTF